MSERRGPSKRRPARKQYTPKNVNFYNDLNKVKYRLWKKFVFQPRLKNYLNSYYNEALNVIIMLTQDINNIAENNRHKLERYLRGEAEILSRKVQKLDPIILLEPIIIIMKEVGINQENFWGIFSAIKSRLLQQGIFPPRESPMDVELQDMQLPHGIIEKLKRKYRD